MSNRFHNKWHRRNHHTYGNPFNPDASHDPIASQPQPFLGEFCLWGSLSCVAPPSAYGAHIYCDNTALCAWAGKRGAYIFSHGYMGAEIHGTTNIGISAWAPIMGLEIASNVRTISAFSHYIGMDLYSNNIGISATTDKMGFELYSGHTGISAVTDYMGIDLRSYHTGISATTDKMGFELYSGHTGISATVDYMGFEVATGHTAISAVAGYMGLELYSSHTGISSVADNMGYELYSRNVGISSVADNIGYELYSRNVGISSVADNIGYELHSNNVGISSVSNNIGYELYSGNIGISATTAYMGIELISHNTGISAVTDHIGIDLYSRNIGISAVAENIGIELRSTNVGISTIAENIGLELYSGHTGISAVADYMGLEVYSLNTAISGYASSTGIHMEATDMGAEIISPTVALKTDGGGVNILNSSTGIFKTPETHGNYFSGVAALDVAGNTFIDGDTVITGNLSALGTLSYLDTKVTVTSSFRIENTGSDAAATIIQTGSQPILACYDKDVSGSVPSLVVDGATNGWVGLGVKTPTCPFNIVKNTTSSQGNNQPQIRVSDDNTTTKILVTTPITSYINSSIGTETNSTFDIVSNGTPRIRVSNTGTTSILSARIGDLNTPTSVLDVAGPIATNSSSSSINAASYAVLSTDSSLIFARSINSATTVTLPTPSSCTGRWLYLKNISSAGASATVVSASSNVQQLASASVNSNILPASAGSWVWLQSNGTYWVIMAA